MSKLMDDYNAAKQAAIGKQMEYQGKMYTYGENMYVDEHIESREFYRLQGRRCCHTCVHYKLCVPAGDGTCMDCYNGFSAYSPILGLAEGAESE